MANWKQLLKQVLLADGNIDSQETALLKAEILADGVVDNEEVDFLFRLRNEAKQVSPEFTTFFFSALSSNILADGAIDAEEAARLRKILFADGIIDDDEKVFLNSLKASAKKTSPEFEALYAECIGKR